MVFLEIPNVPKGTVFAVQVTNDFLTEVQHGFRSKHSCEAQLFLTTNDLATAIDNKAQVGMAILDFSKLLIKSN